MDSSKDKLRAIDFYSGIGGWSLGLKMAGIEVVASYEWWDKANRTNHRNNLHPTSEIDIRGLALSSLPTDVDVVVGSPPCTQFSFANRGGSGDIEDGLKDIEKFLSVVDHVKPKFWAMENVPRVAAIIEREMLPGGRLAQYAHLAPTIKVVDMSEWGLPQRRQRCIAGKFDFSLLYAYQTHTKPRTLGEVVRALSPAVVTDPIYGISFPALELHDHSIEEFLSDEEERMNRDMKVFHPVYNNMAFPDPLNRTARTITATCTRVSRESIVIEAPEQKGRFRRLTVRERGCLQGFPITYQFYGDTYPQKLKMIGNAIPPLFTYYIGQAMRGIAADSVLTPEEGIQAFTPPSEVPPTSRPDSVGGTYPASRRFRAAIPLLRFKSGVRFELSNHIIDGCPSWKISFFFGNSKNIHELRMDNSLRKALETNVLLNPLLPKITDAIAHVEHLISSTDATTLQEVWSHSRQHGVRPYNIVDVLGEATEKIISLLEDNVELAAAVLESTLHQYRTTLGYGKVMKHSAAVLAGLLVGTSANTLFQASKFNKPLSRR